MSQDKDSFEDAALEAFVQGKGELAQRLRDLPQPEPSPELDAAILDRIETELKQSVSSPAAMNDPVGPGLLTRWRLPLAAAAGGLFALLVVMQQGAEDAALQTAAGEPVESISARSADLKESRLLQEKAESAERYQLDQIARNANVGEGKLKDAMPSRELHSELPAAPPAPVSAMPPKPDAPVASPSVDSRMAEPDTQLAQQQESRSRLEETVVGRVVAPSTPVETDADIGAYTAQRYNSSQAAMAEPKLERQVDSLEHLVKASPIADAEQAPVAATPPPAMDAQPAASKRADSSASGRFHTNATPPSAAPVVTLEEPKPWLARIEKLLNSDKPEHAWPEWEKFRKAYPHYTVDEKLEARLKVLKK